LLAEVVLVRVAGGRLVARAGGITTRQLGFDSS